MGPTRARVDRELKGTLDELRCQVAEISRRTHETETFGQETRLRANRAVGLYESARVELDTIRGEMVGREEIARHEALALQKAVADCVDACMSAADAMTTSATLPRGPEPPSSSNAALLGFERAATQVEERISEIEDRVVGADEVVRGLARPPRTAGPAPHRKPSGNGSQPKPEPEKQRLDINTITFEQLRELGLSVTQAARLLARRDVRGAYRSLEEIDGLLEVPAELIDRLKRTLRID